MSKYGTISVNLDSKQILEIINSFNKEMNDMMSRIKTLEERIGK